MKTSLLLLIALAVGAHAFTQNVGIGTATPAGKLHIKGNADTSQLVIDANTIQSPRQPLIRLRNAAGADLLHIHSDAPYNTFVGAGAGRDNIPSTTGFEGLFNTFIGSGAGYQNTHGFANTVVGRNALFYNTEGTYNTAVGFKALFSNLGISGSILGSYNTAIGSQSLMANSTGTSNTAVGYNALFLNTNSLNTAVGSEALSSNTSGLANTAVGVNALHDNTTFPNNTAVGTSALARNTTGHTNTAMGTDAMIANISGKENVAIGGFSMNTPTQASNNTVIGFRADVTKSNGANNVVIGNGASVYGQNSIAIGFNTFINVDHMINFGNSSTTVIGGYANWSNFSDGRFKKDVREDVKGLDFILRLRPVTYHMNVRALHDLWKVSPYGKDETIITASHKTEIDNTIRNKEAVAMSGFIAQEVEQAAKQSGYDFDGVIKPVHSQDHYRLAYSEFVVPLVKAVQEQQRIIEKQMKKSTNSKKGY